MVIDDMGPDQYRVTRTTPDGKSDSYGLIDLEEPAHDVRITKGFWIGQTPVTVEVYQQCARDTGAAMPVEPPLQYPLEEGQASHGKSILV